MSAPACQIAAIRTENAAGARGETACIPLQPMHTQDCSLTMTCDPP